MFNYLGTFSSGSSSEKVEFQLTADSAGPLSGGGQRIHLIDVNSLISDRKLSISIGYSSNIYKEATIAKLGKIFEEIVSEACDNVSDGSENIPVFLVHPVDGNTSDLERIEIPKHVIEFSEISYDSLSDMASKYTKQVAQQTSTHVILGGYSFGGIVAYEMAKQMLSHSTTSVNALVLIDQFPLQSGNRNSRLPSNHLGTFAIQIAETVIKSKLSEQQRSSLNSATTVAHVMQILGGISGIQSEFLDLLNTRISTYFTCANLLNGYDMPQEDLGIPIFLVRSSVENLNMPEDYGWSKFTTKQVQVVKVNATHYNILKPEFSVTICETLKTFLVGLDK